MELKGKRVLVVGAAKSGLASVRFLLDQGASVILSDSKTRESFGNELDDLEQRGVQLMLGQQFAENISWDLVVTSPGVPPMIPLLMMSRNAGCEVIGEVELAYRFSQVPFLGVTGTNGKTTTTSLLGFILQQAGKEVLVGGNIGAPLAETAPCFNGEYIVAELSSFQLESCVDFHAHVGIYLNLTPDHLNRHGTMENYAAAKERLFANMTKDDFAILSLDDEPVRGAAERTQASILWFSLEQPVDEGMYFDGSAICVRENGQTVYSFPAANIYIKGRHNMQNAMAAALAAHCVGVSYDDIARALTDFKGVEHRLEFVCERDGVIYINDSKGTNPDSTLQALRAYDQPQILLLGGYDKGSDFLPLFAEIEQRVRKLIIYGACLPSLLRAVQLAGFKNYEVADNCRDAISRAIMAAQPGEVVMFSPACASWDEFDNFEQRGELFKQMVTR